MNICDLHPWHPRTKFKQIVYIPANFSYLFSLSFFSTSSFSFHSYVFFFSSLSFHLPSCSLFRLFEEHSELLGLFQKFKELKTKEQQAQSEELAEHANKVMETLDEGIRGLDDLDTFFAYLHTVGASHTRIPGFKAEYFWVSFISININVLVQYLGCVDLMVGPILSFVNWYYWSEMQHRNEKSKLKKWAALKWKLSELIGNNWI